MTLLTCPWLNQMASTTPSTALSRSAESKMMTGDLPPSSSDSFLPEPAVARRSTWPIYDHEELVIVHVDTYHDKLVFNKIRVHLVARKHYNVATSVEPVKPTFSTSGCNASLLPIAPLPVITLKTPGGKPASAQIYITILRAYNRQTEPPETFCSSLVRCTRRKV